VYKSKKFTYISVRIIPPSFGFGSLM